MGEIDGETSANCKESAELFAREVMPRFKDTQTSPQPELSAAKWSTIEPRAGTRGVERASDVRITLDSAAFPDPPRVIVGRTII